MWKPDREQFDFSTWEGFGKLWEWAKKQEWWLKFGEGLSNKQLCSEISRGLQIDESIINPDRFADALYDFLKGREG